MTTQIKATKDYILQTARYAKKSVALRVLDSRDGMMGRASRVASALNGRWSNREKAYILSESKGRKFVELFDAGKDASLKVFGVHSADYVLDTAP